MRKVGDEHDVPCECHETCRTYATKQSFDSDLLETVHSSYVVRVMEDKAVVVNRVRQWVFFGCMLGALQGCASHDVHADANSSTVASTTVSCTVNAPSVTPCLDQAQRACHGDARLQAIQSRAQIPVTEGAAQSSAPLYQYVVAYTCRS